ncbi:MAG TPA: hypothetical protein VGM88_31805 [Kofleriaceae bacterium]|jgi:hypothetical protein
MTKPPKVRDRFGKATLVAWFVVVAMVSAGVLARHLVAMPVPAKTARFGATMLALRHAGAPSSWLAVHVLSSECRCSLRVVDHLVSTVRPDGWSEIVLWIGDVDPPAELAARFDVRRVTPAELAKLGIEAAPLLVAVSPDGVVRYAGGYTDRKQGPVNHDLEILAAARGDGPVPSFPLFGCAVSERLQQALSTLPSP